MFLLACSVSCTLYFNLEKFMSVKELLSEYGLSPKKHLGQNFLINKNLPEKIVMAGEVSSSDTVLEVGGGFGVLTEKLAQAAKEVIVVEKDETLALVLKEKFKNNKNVKIIKGDILKTDLSELENYKIIANLPYQISSIFLKRFLSAKNKPNLIVLMLQKEVVERILAKPGKMNLLALSVQFFGKPKKIMDVSKNNFYPVPKVDSAVIRIDIKDVGNNKDIIDNLSQLSWPSPSLEEKMFRLAKVGFGQKRKQLKNNLKNLEIPEEQILGAFKKIGLKDSVRPQELSVENWIELTKLLD